jgi:antitoxin (DNA-binding transcriptional repressor) of toxin-antitoxin stability system
MKTPASETPSVGIREFRAALAEYIDADRPVTITRHGEAVGLFVPLRRSSPEDVQRLQAASARFRKCMPLAEHEVEAMVAEFDALRRGQPLPGGKRPQRK